MPSEDVVRDYLQRGFSLVPFKAIRPEQGKTKWGKRPIVKWEDRARTRPDPETVLSEFRANPDCLIGVCTGAVSGICNLDIDSDEGREKADQLISDSLMVPTYRTISGGLQMIFEAPTPCPSGAVRFLPGLDFRGTGSVAILPPHRLGYSWMPGLSLADVAPPRMPNALSSAITKTSTLYRERYTSPQTAEGMFTDGRRDNDLFHTANTLVKGGMPPGEIAQVLERLILSWGERPDPKWIADKIASAKKRSDRRSGDVTKTIEEWVSVTDGYFSVTECCKALQSVTDSGQTTIRGILRRLAQRGIIEKHGGKDGVYRRIDTELQPLDWKNADTSPLSMRWPFGIERLVNLYPGNLAVIAGAPNAGKTAFILNFIRMNQADHDVHVFTSEGGKEELKLRILKFGLPVDSWRFSAWDRSGNWADVIRPDAINIIDYLELHDDFYKIGGILKSISDKLKSGFALVALQKNPGRDEGLGGARSLEKPRLYLSMDKGQTKIVKAKSWVDGSLNPNGMSIKWKLVDGCKFINVSEWRGER